jgi:hypothetical protein
MQHGTNSRQSIKFCRKKPPTLSDLGNRSTNVCSGSIPAALPSKAQAYSRLIPRTVGSNHTEGIDVRLLVFVVCFVGSSLCDELMPLSKESHLYVELV